jgi:RNA polymerase sigma-70 factor, ECF subfamily
MTWGGRLRWRTTSWGLLRALGKTDNAEAWRQFDRRYGEIVRQFCRQRGLQHADAEDVAQRVFLDLDRRVGELAEGPERAKFRSWLSTVILRAIWKVRRRNGRELLSEDLDELSQASSAAETDEIGAAVFEVAVEQVRAEFDDQEWEVFERNWRRDQPHAVVARELGRPIGWVYRTKFRILQRLKQQVATLSANIAWPPDSDG